MWGQGSRAPRPSASPCVHARSVWDGGAHEHVFGTGAGLVRRRQGDTRATSFSFSLRVRVKRGSGGGTGCWVGTRLQRCRAAQRAFKQEQPPWAMGRGAWAMQGRATTTSAAAAAGAPHHLQRDDALVPARHRPAGSSRCGMELCLDGRAAIRAQACGGQRVFVCPACSGSVGLKPLLMRAGEQRARMYAHMRHAGAPTGACRAGARRCGRLCGGATGRRATHACLHACMLACVLTRVHAGAPTGACRAGARRCGRSCGGATS
jgi:hypothetical protein